MSVSEEPSTHQLLKKKRVGKACDSCRIKKTKCDGKKPCNRCILDNKICVFTEKKKPKEKKHPLGYVELLETRLDILTKLFEKLITLSRPHLQFIEDIVAESSLESPLSSNEESVNPVSEDGESQVVPINKVVCYLINQKGLLQNLPVEWEQGAIIAANYDASKNLEESSRLFADHKLENTAATSPMMSPTLIKRRNSKKRSLSKLLLLQQQQQVTTPHVDQIQEDEFSPEELYFPTDGPFLKKETVSSPHFSLSSGQYTPANPPSHAQFSLTGFNTNFGSHDGNISDIDSDSSHKENGNNSDSVSPQNMNDYRTSSLFSNSGDMPVIGKTASLTSLTNKYEKHTLSSPQSTTAPSSIFTNGNADPILATLRRSSSSLSQKTMGSVTTGVQKSKSSVHKPPHHHSRVSSFDKRLDTASIHSTSNTNFTFDNRYEELDDGNTSSGVGFNNYVAPPLPQPPSPSDTSVVFNSLGSHLNVNAGAANVNVAAAAAGPAAAATTGGGLDLLVDNTFDPFFNNNNNPFTGKYQMG
ncbi:Fluconazole resistance protein 1 [Candida viswanathii]|uniref:Fluconazole resistance protein 1 n=1 Tax=Candida viswanathii TaxID=5486 RepID=A0A367YEU2_9ASCO|nr:Fluconazole resistance protein 1 [Candida viswanathii]